MWEIINFCLLLILLIIVIAVVLFSILSYYKIKYYVDDAISHIGSLIPTFDPYEFVTIEYPSDNNLSKLINNDDKYNNELAILLCNVNMSTYNKYSGFDPKIKGIYLDDNINDVGYIFKSEKDDILIFSFRGTKTNDDIITDLDSVQSEMNEFNSYKTINNIDIKKEILVHRGFYRAWTSYKENLVKYIKKNIKDTTKVLVTGHSLGCSAAIFTSMIIGFKYTKNIKLYMFAPPRIGNHHFIENLNEIVPNNYSIINTPDLIPNLPPVTFTTIGTWFYDNFTNRIQLDYQLGTIPLNHRLDTYLCGLLTNDLEIASKCKDPIWKRDTIINI